MARLLTSLATLALSTERVDGPADARSIKFYSSSSCPEVGLLQTRYLPDLMILLNLPAICGAFLMFLASCRTWSSVKSTFSYSPMLAIYLLSSLYLVPGISCSDT